jgi:hypothetical protein
MKLLTNTPSNAKPTFSSRNLNEAFDEVLDVFEHHQQDIDNVSEDIKNIEVFIQSRNVSIPYSQHYEPQFITGRYRLHWDRANAESKDFRLLCSFEEWSQEQDIWVSKPVRPLIECSLTTRMALYSFLPYFVKALAKAIKIFHREKPAEPAESDVPF